VKTYLDSSVLVSLYSLDANSAPAARLLENLKGERLISSYGQLEVTNALHLRVFRKELPSSQVQHALKIFEQDLRDGVFRLRALPEGVFERSARIARQTTPRLGTRTADLLHVAAALELGADYLYTFDDRQKKLAEALRLKTN